VSQCVKHYVSTDRFSYSLLKQERSNIVFALADNSTDYLQFVQKCDSSWVG